jgi:hypothetical protein
MAGRAPTPFTLWLDEALSGWLLPVAALVLVGGIGLLYYAGFASEEDTASLVVLALSLGAALYLVRPALDARRDPVTRAVVAAAAALTLVAAGLPAYRSVRPGSPLFSGELAAVDDAVPVPPGASGRVRLLVSGRLPQRGQPSVLFTLSGPREPVEGQLERTFTFSRVGRRGRARVAHDHTADFYEASIPAGTAALKLDRVEGELGGPLYVSAYRDPVAMPWGPWLLALAATALACAADARLGQKNQLGVAAGIAASFGLLVAFNATPASAVGPALGGVILGAISGSLGAWLIGLIVGRVVPPARRANPPRDGSAAA